MRLVEWIINNHDFQKGAELYRRYNGASVPLRIEGMKIKRTGHWSKEENADWVTHKGRICIGSDYISNERR